MDKESNGINLPSGSGQGRLVFLQISSPKGSSGNWQTLLLTAEDKYSPDALALDYHGGT